jgi:hypothetical protein
MPSKVFFVAIGAAFRTASFLALVALRLDFGRVSVFAI